MLFIDLVPIILLAHCSFISLLKSFLSPQGILYFSLLVFLSLIGIQLNYCVFTFKQSSLLFVDYGQWLLFFNTFDSHLIFIFDLLAVILTLLVSFLAPLALVFGSEYMFREAFLARLLILLNLFAASVIFLFISYDFFFIIFAWECIGLFSLLLVNFYATRVFTIKAAFKTFVFSRISDLFLFTALVWLMFLFQSLDLSLIFLQTPFFMFHYTFIGNYSLHSLSLLSLSVAISGLVKSAQFGFHIWLPDAMEAPTPASALIHSSTLVIAGIFLILRFALFFDFTPTISTVIALWGAVTLSTASIIAIFQKDIKKLVAYSTISQIGYLVSGCGICAYNETLLYLITHALNKAFLFILVGYIVHFFNGNTDLRFMGGVWLYSFDALIIFFSLILNLIGLPYSVGFISKEFLLIFFFKKNFLFQCIGTCWLVGLFCSPIYMTLFLVKVFFAALKHYQIQVEKNQFLFTKISLFYQTSFISLAPLLVFLFFWIIIWFGLNGLYHSIFAFNILNHNVIIANIITSLFNPITSIALVPTALLTYLSQFIFYNLFITFWFWYLTLYKNVTWMSGFHWYALILFLLNVTVFNFTKSFFLAFK